MNYPLIIIYGFICVIFYIVFYENIKTICETHPLLTNKKISDAYKNNTSEKWDKRFIQWKKDFSLLNWKPSNEPSYILYAIRLIVLFLGVCFFVQFLLALGLSAIMKVDLHKESPQWFSLLMICSPPVLVYWELKSSFRKTLDVYLRGKSLILDDQE
jgi:hypothetical protein